MGVTESTAIWKFTPRPSGGSSGPVTQSRPGSQLIEHQLGLAQFQIGKAVLDALVAHGKPDNVAVEPAAGGNIGNRQLGDQCRHHEPSSARRSGSRKAP